MKGTYLGEVKVRVVEREVVMMNDRTTVLPLLVLVLIVFLYLFSIWTWPVSTLTSKQIF